MVKESETEIGNVQIPEAPGLIISHISGKRVLIISEKQKIVGWFSAYTLVSHRPSSVWLCHLPAVSKNNTWHIVGLGEH